MKTDEEGHPHLKEIHTKCKTVKFDPEKTHPRIVHSVANVCLKSQSYGNPYESSYYGKKDHYDTDYKCYDQKHKITYNEPVPQPDDVDCKVKIPELKEHVKPHIVETPTFKCDKTHETEILIMIPTPISSLIHADICTVEVDVHNPHCTWIPLTIPQQVCNPPYEAKTVYVPVIPPHDPYKHEQHDPYKQEHHRAESTLTVV